MQRRMIWMSLVPSFHPRATGGMRGGGTRPRFGGRTPASAPGVARRATWTPARRKRVHVFEPETFLVGRLTLLALLPEELAKVQVPGSPS